MNGTVRALAVVLVGWGLIVPGTAPAASDEFCPMGGTLIKIEVNKDKVLDWAKDRRKSAVADVDKDGWSVLTLSTTDDDIAIQIKKDAVFFGVAGRGKAEVDDRLADRTFGNSFRKLRDAVKKEMGELRQARVVDIDGSDIQPLADAVGLGVLEKKGRSWELTTEKCTGVDIDASALK